MHKALAACTAEKSPTEENTDWKHHIPYFSQSQDNLLNSDKVHILCISEQILQHTEDEESTLTHNTHTSWTALKICSKGNAEEGKEKPLKAKIWLGVKLKTAEEHSGMKCSFDSSSARQGGKTAECFCVLSRAGVKMMNSANE